MSVDFNDANDKKQADLHERYSKDPAAGVIHAAMTNAGVNDILKVHVDDSDANTKFVFVVPSNFSRSNFSSVVYNTGDLKRLGSQYVHNVTATASNIRPDILQDAALLYNVSKSEVTSSDPQILKNENGTTHGFSFNVPAKYSRNNIVTELGVSRDAIQRKHITPGADGTHLVFIPIEAAKEAGLTTFASKPKPSSAKPSGFDRQILNSLRCYF